MSSTPSNAGRSPTVAATDPATFVGFDAVADAHLRLEVGGLEGKLVLCPDARASA